MAAIDAHSTTTANERPHRPAAVRDAEGGSRELAGMNEADGQWQARVHTSPVIQRLARTRNFIHSSPRVLDQGTRIHGIKSGLSPAIQRILDDDFRHGGEATPEETAACQAFAQRVSDLVDQAYADLIRGNVADWEGVKFATFLNLLLNESPFALPWVGNAIEERVYQQMESGGMPLAWTAQHAEGMGGASRPDIVVQVAEGKEALIDITSESGHILRKAGGWTTSRRYVYVAEAQFPSITAEQLPGIRENIRRGGVGIEEATAMAERATAARAEADARRAAEADAAREEYQTYPSFAAYARDKFGGSRAEASNFLRSLGISVRGMTKRAARRAPDPDTIAARRRAAARRRKKRARDSEEENAAAGAGTDDVEFEDIDEDGPA